jgi:putative MATE family efflux protein
MSLRFKENEMDIRNFGTDLTEGNIPRHLLRFSIPMLLGNLIQIGYSVINTIWVGHLVGENAVGAAGMSLPIIFVTIGLAMGLTMATTILVAQYFGARDYEMLGRVVNNSFSLALMSGVILTLLGILGGDYLLRLMKAPPENFAMASSYLKISFLSTTLMFMSFLIGSILRGIGDTITPTTFMAIGVGLNAILDPFFIGGFGPFVSHGLNGAAYATILSQVISLTVSLTYLNRKNHVIAFSFRKLVFDRRITLLIFKIGLPAITQQSLVSLAHMLVLSIVNSFGSAATNALGAVARVDMFAFMPAMSMSMAVSTLTAQNLGAQKPERIKAVFGWGFLMTSIITIAISLMAVLFSGPILRAFGLGGDLKVMEIGGSYLHIVGACYICVGVMFVCGGVINGSGHTMVTMVFSILAFWLIRVPAAWYLSATSLGVRGVWFAVALSFATGMVMSLTYYFSGRWKRAVIIKSAEPIVPCME